MEINNDINEIVYMKRDIKSHRIYEKHPNLMFGIIILVWGLLFFFGCFSDVYWVYWMVLVIIIVPITIWYIKNGSIIFFVGLTLPRYRFSKPSASLDMNLR